VFAFAPPPPPPVLFLPPPPPEFVVLPPPPPPIVLFALPVPVYRPVPLWVRAPAYVAPPPPNNVYFANLHNTAAVERETNVVKITTRTGEIRTWTPPPAGAVGPPGTRRPVAAIGPALPPSVAPKALPINTRIPPGAAPGTSPQPLPTGPMKPLLG